MTETRISIHDPEAAAFRAAIVEGMMLNHPHDCPVCDEGGECHLQDMTVMTGHDYRRTRFEKRTFRNQYLGPFLYHEMNRCIQCYRCVRFYREYAGGNDLNAFGIKNAVYFGRNEDGVLENEFAGNLVEVCPTGVFTDRTLRRHYTRKWDLRMAPSICVHCGSRLQYHHRRALWASAPGLDPVQQRGERLLPLRPRALWLRVRQQRPTEFAPHGWTEQPISARRSGAETSVSRFERRAGRSASARPERRLRPTSRCASWSGRIAFLRALRTDEWRDDLRRWWRFFKRGRPVRHRFMTLSSPMLC